MEVYVLQTVWYLVRTRWKGREESKYVVYTMSTILVNEKNELNTKKDFYVKESKIKQILQKLVL